MYVGHGRHVGGQRFPTVFNTSLTKSSRRSKSYGKARTDTYSSLSAYKTRETQHDATMEVLREAPKPTAFVPLPEHQSATPASFYAGPAVLHYYSDRAKVIILEHELAGAPALASLMRNSSIETSAESAESNGDSTDVPDEKKRIANDVDVWVTSECVFHGFSLSSSC